MTTALSLLALPKTFPGAIGAKAAAGLPPYGLRIAAFDTWRPGYSGMIVEVIEAGTVDNLAPLFFDIGLTQPAPNPQTLISYTDGNGNTYGKWAQPIYTSVPYLLYINSTDSTGIEYPPLIALAGQDLSGSLVSSVRGQYPVTLADFADNTVVATNFGQLSYDAGSAACTATLVAATGAAAAQGGGMVQLPAGTIPFTSLTLAEGVVLVGDSINATTLQSSQTGNVITFGGDGSGLMDLTLDGLDVIAASIGVYGLDIAQPIFENVLIKRFDQGIMFKGASGIQWRNFSISNCNTAADCRGDSDVTGTDQGAEFANCEWDGGAISVNVNFGLRFRFVDLPAREIVLRNVGFVSNVGPALALHGTRGVTCDNCYWESNVADLLVEDDLNPLYQATNTTERILIRGGQISGGTLTFNQSCVDVALEGIDIQNASYVLTIPTNTILLRNCQEDSATTATGATTKIARWSDFDEGVVSGVTTSATPVVAWQYTMSPGEVGLFSAVVVANQANGVQVGTFWPMIGCYQPGATLPFSSQTANFTAGAVLTGQTSGASARLTAVTQSGGAGSVTLRDIVGTFLNGEVITDSAGGTARMNGTIVTYSTALDATGNGAIRAATITGTGWSAVWAVTGSLIQLVVTGQSSATIDWTAKVTKTSA